MLKLVAAAGVATGLSTKVSASTGPDGELEDIHDGLSGSGTSSDPYIITDAEELQSIDVDMSAHYKLGNDIDANNTVNWEWEIDDSPQTDSGFIPLGWDETLEGDRDHTPFTGTFDGDGHVIKDLYISGAYYVFGLFCQENGSEMKNLGILNWYVNTGGTDWNWDCGVLCGYCEGGEETTIKNIYVDSATVVEGPTGATGVLGEAHNVTIENVVCDAAIRSTEAISGIVFQPSEAELYRCAFRGDFEPYDGEYYDEVAGLGFDGAGADISECIVISEVELAEDAEAYAGTRGGDLSDNYFNLRFDVTADTWSETVTGANLHVHDSTPDVATENLVTGGATDINPDLGDDFQNNAYPFSEVYDGATSENNYYSSITEIEDENQDGVTEVIDGDLYGDSADEELGGFDFENTWKTRSDNYPILQWLEEWEDENSSLFEFDGEGDDDDGNGGGDGDNGDGDDGDGDDGDEDNGDDDDGDDDDGDDDEDDGIFASIFNRLGEDEDEDDCWRYIRILDWCIKWPF